MKRWQREQAKASYVAAYPSAHVVPPLSAALAYRILFVVRQRCGSPCTLPAPLRVSLFVARRRRGSGKEVLSPALPPMGGGPVLQSKGVERRVMLGARMENRQHDAASVLPAAPPPAARPCGAASGRRPCGTPMP